MLRLTRALGATTALTLAHAAAAQSTPPSEAGGTRNPATPTVTSYPQAAAGDGANVGGFNLSRWAEDWSALRDPAKRDDPLDRRSPVVRRAQPGAERLVRTPLAAPGRTHRQCPRMDDPAE